MDLTKVLELDKVERFDTEFNGEKFWFEAKSHKLTPNFHQAINDAAKQPITLATALAEVVTAWNITLGGEDFPPTAENFAKIPEEFIFHLVDVIAASWSADQKKAKASANG